MSLSLITGGARSGKSTFALARAREHSPASGARFFVATAQAGDDEMRARIERHRAERDATWRTVEAPLDPVAMLRAVPEASVVVLDCMTFWISNLIQADYDDAAIEHRVSTLAAEAIAARAGVYVVTNEVGMGIVPTNALARRYRDVVGRANQRLGAAAEEVWLLVAGQPLRIK
jgi:adenosylcobinamide kinase/adenosylcobinamide-phosphate guanylyltransferase